MFTQSHTQGALTIHECGLIHDFRCWCTNRHLRLLQMELTRLIYFSTCSWRSRSLSVKYWKVLGSFSSCAPHPDVKEYQKSIWFLWINYYEKTLWIMRKSEDQTKLDSYNLITTLTWSLSSAFSRKPHSECIYMSTFDCVDIISATRFVFMSGGLGITGGSTYTQYGNITRYQSSFPQLPNI